MNDAQKAFFEALPEDLQGKYKELLENQEPEPKKAIEPKTEPVKKAEKVTEPEPNVNIDLDLTEVIEKTVTEKIQKQTIVSKVQNNAFLLETVSGIDADWQNMPYDSIQKIVSGIEQASRKLKPEPVAPPTPKKLDENLVDFKDWYKKNMIGRRY